MASLKPKCKPIKTTRLLQALLQWLILFDPHPPMLIPKWLIAETHHLCPVPVTEECIPGAL